MREPSLIVELLRVLAMACLGILLGYGVVRVLEHEPEAVASSAETASITCAPRVPCPN